MVTLDELYNGFKDWSNSVYDDITKPFSDAWNWLTDDDYWDDGVNYAKWKLSDFPVVGYFLTSSDMDRYWNDYFKNTGLSWADAKYPTMMRGAGSYGGAHGAVNFMSANVDRLYRYHYSRL